MKYAVVDNGSNQLIVKQGDTVLVDGHGLDEGKDYVWNKVLFYKDGKKIKVGKPYVKGMKIKGKVVKPVKGPKVINFKKKRRKGYSRKVGHRQKYTQVKIEEL
ncbi:MAG: 50S ribosomal protein L21 [Elusimicrobiota bacterium]